MSMELILGPPSHRVTDSYTRDLRPYEPEYVPKTEKDRYTVTQLIIWRILESKE